LRFTIANYHKAKLDIVERIKYSHKWRENEGFIADGVICPSVFEKQSIKILCVLAESYGYHDRGCIDIEDQLKEDLMGLTDPKVKTPRYLATMLYLLTNSLQRDVKISLEEWREIPNLFQIREEHTEILQSTLAKIAWVNIKKASNPITRKNSDLVRSHARRNKEILRDQIASIAPDLMIICGNDVFSSLIELEIIPHACLQGLPWKIQNYNKCKYIEVSHPACRDWMSYGGLYDIYETIFEQMI